MNNKHNKNLGQFMTTFGICGVIAGCVLLVFGNWQGVFGLISGVFVMLYGFNQIKELKIIKKLKRK